MQSTGIFEMMFYLYVIHFEDFFYYVGKRKCPSTYNPWNDPYTGSPKTNKYKWKSTQFTKVVIECFDNDKDVSLAETNLLKELDWKNDTYCLNECCGLCTIIHLKQKMVGRLLHFLNRPHKPRKCPNYTIILTYATEL